jgi:hypothetical protein
MYGEWTLSIQDYVERVQRYIEHIGNLDWAAPQDWMCEPFILEKTRGTVEAHQYLTVQNYLGLCEAAPDVPWVPVLQGFTREDYMRCFELYELRGIDLAKLPLVAVGSVCRRQGTVEVGNIMRELAGMGLKLHAFGFKIKGMHECGDILESCDSMAWSMEARRLGINTCGQGNHKTCANCMSYALLWRDRILSIDVTKRDVFEQLMLGFEATP